MEHLADRGHTEIACAVRDEPARNLALRTIAFEGGTALLVGGDRLTSPLAPTPYSALICDLAPWNQDALDSFSMFRSQKPGLPVLLYMPSSAAATSLVPECAKMPDIRIQFQSTARDALPFLRKNVRWLLRSSPVSHLMNLITFMLDQTPEPIGQYMGYLLHESAAGRTTTVRSGAAALGLTRRTLERYLADAELPPPKELLDWLRLLYISYTAECSALSITVAARNMGLNSNRFYRLKRRLLDRVQIAGVDPIPTFRQVTLGLADRCGVPRARAKIALNRQARPQ